MATDDAGMLSAAIVDDEPLARSRLRRLLERVAGHRIKVVAECVDVNELLEASRRIHLDVLFLDIELPGGNGFTALQRWNGPTPIIIFVTAYEHHGVRAFAEKAVDYLLKPVSMERLRDTVSRILEKIPLPGGRTDQAGKRISFDVGRRTVLIAEEDIEAVRVKGNYLDIETRSGTFTRRQPLTDFLEELSPDTFFRIHRSTAVRSSAISDVLAIGSSRYMITLKSGQNVVSGRLYSKVVQRLAGRSGRSEQTNGN